MNKPLIKHIRHPNAKYGESTNDYHELTVIYDYTKSQSDQPHLGGYSYSVKVPGDSFSKKVGIDEAIKQDVHEFSFNSIETTAIISVLTSIYKKETKKEVKDLVATEIYNIVNKHLPHLGEILESDFADVKLGKIHLAFKHASGN